MSDSRISNGPSSGRVGGRLDKEARDQQAFDAATSAVPVPRESFISSVSSSRQPPRLLLDDAIEEVPSTSVKLFGAETESLSRRDDLEVAGDLAEIYLEFSKEAQQSGDPEIVAAFEHLGDVMLNYEHVRLLRTGGLG